MQDMIDHIELVRYNTGKVDWTLLPWDRNLLQRLSDRLKSIEEVDRDDLFLALFNEDVFNTLCYSLLLSTSYNQTPELISNLPWRALEDVCRVFSYGCVKYQRDNYKIAPGLPLESYIQSMWRHTVSYLKGEELDIDSGLPNLSHLACNCFMYLWTQKEYHNDSK